MNKRFAVYAAVERFSLVMWVGGMWTIAMTAAVLFSKIADRTLAGEVAGTLFTVVNYTGLTAAALLMVVWGLSWGRAFLKQWRLWVLLVMVALIITSQGVLRPRMDAIKAEKAQATETERLQTLERRFQTLHKTSSRLYMVNALLGLVLVVVVVSRPRGESRG